MLCFEFPSLLHGALILRLTALSFPSGELSCGKCQKRTHNVRAHGGLVNTLVGKHKGKVATREEGTASREAGSKPY